MPQIVEFNGSRIEFPDGMAAGDIEAALKANALSIPPAKAAAPTGFIDSQINDVKKDFAAIPGRLGNIVAGGVNGAADLGATLLTPVDAAARALGVRNDYIGRTDRREATTGALQDFGADPNSLQFKAGRLGAQFAGTAGAGGVLAKAARVALPLLRIGAPTVDAIATGLQTGGMSFPGLSGAAGMAARVGTGAATGGAMAGMVDPKNAPAGALIGGVLPPAVMVAGKAGQFASDKMQDAARWLMTTALKPTIKMHQTGDAAVAARTLLDNGINANAGGVQKLRGLLDATDNKISTALSGSTATIDKNAVLRRLDDARAKFSNQVTPQGDLGAIDAAQAAFQAHPGFPGNDIPVQAAQDLKRGTYQVLSNKYGQLGSADVEAQKALARGLKEEIASAVPGISDLNGELSNLTKTLKVTERRALMDMNKNPIGLAALAHNPIGWAAFMADKSALFKSLAARAVNNVAPVAGQSMGLLGPAAANPLLRGGLLATEANP